MDVVRACQCPKLKVFINNQGKVITIEKFSDKFGVVASTGTDKNLFRLVPVPGHSARVLLLELVPVPGHGAQVRARCPSTTSGASALAWARCPN